MTHPVFCAPVGDPLPGRPFQEGADARLRRPAKVCATRCLPEDAEHNEGRHCPEERRIQPSLPVCPGLPAKDPADCGQAGQEPGVLHAGIVPDEILVEELDKSGTLECVKSLL